MVSLKHKILMHLIEHKYTEFSIHELSRLLEKDYKNVYTALKHIKDSVRTRKKGNATFVAFTPVLTEDVYLVERSRRSRLSLNLDVERPRDPFFVAVIFGSYATGTHTTHSDIDLCLIHDNAEEFESIQRHFSIHPKVDIHGFHYTEFISMLNEKSFNVGHEIVKKGIVLKNLESYYELITYEWP